MCVGLHVQGFVSTSVRCCRYKRSIKFMQFVFFIWLCVSLFFFLPSLQALFSPSAEYMCGILSERRTPSDNSTAEARFNCPGGGKLNTAVNEKFLPLPFHLNLWLLAVVLLSAATHWEAWNEKSFSVYWDSCSVERTGYSEISFSFIPARAHSKQCARSSATTDRESPKNILENYFCCYWCHFFHLCPSAWLSSSLSCPRLLIPPS